VPDFYQGSELWNLTLVDPDNRMPVDYALREATLERLLATAPEDQPAQATALLSTWQDGRIKLLLTQRGLAARALQPDLFEDGSYLSLAVDGDRQRHVFAFARRHGENWAVFAFPRLCARLCELFGLPVDRPPLGESTWGDAVLRFPADAPAHWINNLTGESLVLDRFGERLELPLARLFQRFPFALLTPANGD